MCRFTIFILSIDNCTDTCEEAANASGFTVLHQAAFNNAEPDFVQMLVDYGAWSTSSVVFLRSCEPGVANS